MPENIDAFLLWSIVQGQIITGGMGGAIDINHLALWKDIDEYEKQHGSLNRWKIFVKIIKLFAHMKEVQEEQNRNKKSKPIE